MEEGERAVAARRRGGAVRAEEVVLLPPRPLRRAADRQVHAPQRPDDCEFSGKCTSNYYEGIISGKLDLKINAKGFTSYPIKYQRSIWSTIVES